MNTDHTSHNKKGNLRVGPDVLNETIDHTSHNKKGNLQGHFVRRYDDGQGMEGGAEGSFVDGKKQGHWIHRLGFGVVQEGPFMDSKKHGKWVERYPDGTVLESLYMYDKKHGKEVWWHADGRVEESYYNNGNKVDESTSRCWCGWTD